MCISSDIFYISASQFFVFITKSTCQYKMVKTPLTLINVHLTLLFMWLFSNQILLTLSKLLKTCVIFYHQVNSLVYFSTYYLNDLVIVFFQIIGALSRYFQYMFHDLLRLVDGFYVRHSLKCMAFSMFQNIPKNILWFRFTTLIVASLKWARQPLRVSE